jgi:hypothetical protein
MGSTGKMREGGDGKGRAETECNSNVGPKGPLSRVKIEIETVVMLRMEVVDEDKGVVRRWGIEGGV